LPGGINGSSLVWIGRCIVAMVAALDRVDRTSMLWPGDSLSRSGNERVWFSGAREPVQVGFVQMVELLCQFMELAIDIFWVL